MKLAFNCDYLEGAHEKILKRLIDTNREKTVGYGDDPYCAMAAENISKGFQFFDCLCPGIQSLSPFHSLLYTLLCKMSRRVCVKMCNNWRTYHAKKEQAVYQITVTERQLELINAALEEFFQLGLNQWWELHKFPFRKLS